jgi:hypothetical protein
MKFPISRLMFLGFDKTFNFPEKCREGTPAWKQQSDLAAWGKDLL